MVSYTVGILAITALGTVIVNWRIVVSLLAVVSALCFLGVIFIHDSPEWLLQKSLDDQAKSAWAFYNPAKSEEKLASAQEMNDDNVEAFAASVEKLKEKLELAKQELENL